MQSGPRQSVPRQSDVTVTMHQPTSSRPQERDTKKIVITVLVAILAVLLLAAILFGLYHLIVYLFFSRPSALATNNEPVNGYAVGRNGNGVPPAGTITNLPKESGLSGNGGSVNTGYATSNQGSGVAPAGTITGETKEQGQSGNGGSGKTGYLSGTMGSGYRVISVGGGEHKPCGPTGNCNTQNTYSNGAYPVNH